MNKVFIHSDPTPNDDAWCFYFYEEGDEFKNYLASKFGAETAFKTLSGNHCICGNGRDFGESSYLYHLGNGKPGDILYNSGVLDFKYYDEMVEFLSVIGVEVVQIDPDVQADFTGYVNEWSDLVRDILKARALK